MPIPPEVATTLQGVTLLDTKWGRLVFRATASEEGIALVAREKDLDELIGYLAADPNHEDDCRRQKCLDTAFAALCDAIEEPQGLCRRWKAMGAIDQAERRRR